MTEKKVDVAILGGGIIGCSAAIALRRSGLSVAVIEKGMCGAQASCNNAGGVRQQGRSLPEIPLSRRAVPLWHSMNEMLGEDIGFRAVGHIRLAKNEEDMAVLEDHAEKVRDYGLNLEIFGLKYVRDNFPWLSDKVVGASFSAECGLANPRLVTPALARKAKSMGAEIHEFTAAKFAQQTGELFEVSTDTFTLKSRFLVNCTGAWAKSICEWFDEHPPVRLRSPNLVVTEPISPLMNRSVAIVGGVPYFRQVDRGNVVFGGGPGWGDLEAERSRPVTETSIAAFEKLVDLVPALKGVNIIRSWSGLEADMPDRMPVLGFSDTTPNLVHAFGMSGHGFQLGPSTGEVIGELIVKGESTTPIDAFRITRYTESDKAVAN